MRIRVGFFAGARVPGKQFAGNPLNGGDVFAFGVDLEAFKFPCVLTYYAVCDALDPFVLDKYADSLPELWPVSLCEVDRPDR